MFEVLLHKMVHRGARFPRRYWKQDFERWQSALMQELPSDDIILRSVLSNPDISDNELARLLAEAIKTYESIGSINQHSFSCPVLKEEAAAFTTLSRLDMLFEQKRAQLKSTLTQHEQIKYDLRLFEHEGVMYCLEYYLTLYKFIRDEQSPVIQKSFIEKEEVDTGMGKVPGLWIDFYRFEVLEKFVFLILNDDVRIQIEQAFFLFREYLLDLRGGESAKFDDYSIEQLIFEFKTFLLRFMNVFGVMGVHQLKSYFLEPFGSKPDLSDIQL